MVATLVPATAIAYDGWDQWWQAVTPPIYLRSSEALWIGLLASDLMVLQVVLLARLPWLEHAWGRSTLTRWHRRLAMWSFWLTLLHMLLFVNQRANQRPRRLLGLFVTDDQMLIASIGTGLIVLVVATSIVAARRRLRYEVWHLSHLWSYVGIALTLPHQLISEDFNRDWALAYWWALYLVGVGLLLAFRVGLPLWRSGRHDLRIESVTAEGPEAVSIQVRGRDLQRWGAEAGQFFVWRFAGPPGVTRGHPYSLSLPPTADRLRLTVAGIGDGARRARSLEVGARVMVEGPYGSLARLPRRHEHVVMLAAGIGVTPVRALLSAPDLRAGEVTVVLRYRDEARAVLLEEVRRVADERGFTLHVLIGPRASPGSWTSASAGPASDLGALVPGIAAADVLVCGPPVWSAVVQRAAVRAGARPRDLHTEQFSW